jgi:putative SOS response-associated peptidase YedK
MCGRFTLTIDPGDLIDVFPGLIIPPALRPRYNIAPSQPVAVIANTGKNELDFFLWGLIPSWAKDPSIGNRMINARAETLAEKPSFKNALRRRRCLILADGFFEWQSLPNQRTKQPHFFQLADRKPFGFAGLWEIWQSPDGSEVRSCTIITTQPNQLIVPVHNRMPVIVKQNDISSWLTQDEIQPSSVSHILTAYPDHLMRSSLVSMAVNNPANDSPACIQPINTEAGM